MTTLNEHSALWELLLFIGIMSLGNGIFQSPNNSLTMSHAPHNMLGISGGVNSLIRNIDMISSVTISVLVLYHRMSDKIGYTVSDYVQGRDDVFIYGMHWVYFVSGAVCMFGMFLTAYRFFQTNKNVTHTFLKQ